MRSSSSSDPEQGRRAAIVFPVPKPSLYPKNSGDAKTITDTVQIDGEQMAVDDKLTLHDSAHAAAMLNVLANDEPFYPGSNYRVTGSSQGLHGGIVSCGTTQCTYTAPVGFIGHDTFTYTATDSIVGGYGPSDVTDSSTMRNHDAATVFAAVYQRPSSLHSTE